MRFRFPFTRRRPVIAAVVLATIAAACASPEAAEEPRAGAPDAPPPPPSRVALPSTDTAALKRVFWDLQGVQQALRTRGLASTPIGSAFDDLGAGRGVALAVGDAELHVVFFGDIAAADAAARTLDLQRLPRARQRAPKEGAIALVNNNMLAVIFPGGDPGVHTRIAEALRPPDSRLEADDAEP